MMYYAEKIMELDKLITALIALKAEWGGQIRVSHATETGQLPINEVEVSYTESGEDVILLSS